MTEKAFNELREMGYTNLSKDEKREYHRLYAQLRKQGVQISGRARGGYSKTRHYCCGEPMVRGKLPRLNGILRARLGSWKPVSACRVCGNVRGLNFK